MAADKTGRRQEVSRGWGTMFSEAVEHEWL